MNNGKRTLRNSLAEGSKSCYSPVTLPKEENTDFYSPLTLDQAFSEYQNYRKWNITNKVGGIFVVLFGRLNHAMTWSTLKLKQPSADIQIVLWEFKQLEYKKTSTSHFIIPVQTPNVAQQLSSF